jgi:hypothetical protein
MSKGVRVCDRRIRDSDFGIPSDFVIRHSDFRRAVHGKTFFAFRFTGNPVSLLPIHWDHEPLLPNVLPTSRRQGLSPVLLPARCRHYFAVY